MSSAGAEAGPVASAAGAVERGSDRVDSATSWSAESGENHCRADFSQARRVLYFSKIILPRLTVSPF